MEGLGLLGYLFGLGALEETRKTREKLEYEQTIEDYKKNYCSKGQHFVGAATMPYCEGCGKWFDYDEKTEKGVWKSPPKPKVPHLKAKLITNPKTLKKTQ